MARIAYFGCDFGKRQFACLALGAVGIANMWFAIFADVGVMILAILNTIRALRVHDL